MEKDRRGLDGDMEVPEVFITIFGASEEGLGRVWREELNGCRCVDGMAAEAKKGTYSDQVVGENVVGAKVTRYRLGFVRKVKKANIGARGSKGVPVGEGEGKGGKGEGVKMEER